MSVKEQVFSALKSQPMVRMDIAKLLSLCDEAETTTQIVEVCHRLISSKDSGIQREKTKRGRFEYWFDQDRPSPANPTEHAKPAAESPSELSVVNELQEQVAHLNKIITDQRTTIQALRTNELAAPPYYLVCVGFEVFSTLEDARKEAEAMLSHQSSVIIAAPLQIAERTVTWKTAA